jgi:type II secretory pathway component GspD/PulD (secretin)
LPEFLRITLGELARRPYVLSPDVSSSNLMIAADLTRAKLKDPLPLVRELLLAQGLSMRDVSGVLLIEKSTGDLSKPKAPAEVYIYKPRHRTVGSMSSYFGLFPDLTFSYSSGVSVRSPSPALAATGGAATQASSVMTGATTFSATDADPSFLVVKGPADSLTVFKSFLADLDVPIPEVMLKAYVFEVRDTSSQDSAVSLLASMLNGKVGFSAGAPVAGDALRLTLPNLSVAIKSLTADSRVRLVSAPILRAADGTTASATIGTDTPTLGSIVSQNGSTQQSVSYQSAGVLLSVSPRILDDSIRLSISQELSSFVNTDTGLSGTPTKLRRAFKSDVIARSGEALLLGGLSEAQESSGRSKSFRFFGSDSSSTSSSEIVVLIQVERL